MYHNMSTGVTAGEDTGCEGNIGDSGDVVDCCCVGDECGPD